MAELNSNRAGLSFAPPPSLYPNRALLSLELALALLSPQSCFVQDGGVGGRSGATAEINVSSFSIVRSEQWKHDYEVGMARKEFVADKYSPKRKGVARAAVSCTRRIRPLDSDHSSAERRNIASSDLSKAAGIKRQPTHARRHPRCLRSIVGPVVDSSQRVGDIVLRA